MSSVHIATSGDMAALLKQAILLYCSENQEAVYATIHNVNIDGKTPVLLAGRAMTLPDLATFAAAAARRTAYHGFIDERLIYAGPNTIAWWTPPQRRHVWFGAGSDLGEVSGPANHPGLVFVATGERWYVFALRDMFRPTPESRVYVAPYFNVWDSGQICTGNVDLPDRPGPASIVAYENAFFRSNFTHPNQPRVVKRRGGAKQLWRDLLAGAEFPIRCLIPRNETLADAIARVTKGE
ncbi:MULTISPECIES: PRTRC system protein B [Cupriavidus]